MEQFFGPCALNDVLTTVMVNGACCFYENQKETGRMDEHLQVMENKIRSELEQQWFMELERREKESKDCYIAACQEERRQKLMDTKATAARRKPVSPVFRGTNHRRGLSCPQAVSRRPLPFNNSRSKSLIWPLSHVEGEEPKPSIRDQSIYPDTLDFYRRVDYKGQPIPSLADTSDYEDEMEDIALVNDKTKSPNSGQLMNFDTLNVYRRIDYRGQSSSSLVDNSDDEFEIEEIRFE